MGLDLGVGYAYIKNNITGSSSNFSDNALKVFAKFSY